MVQGDISLDVLGGIVCHSETVLTKLREAITPTYPNLTLKALPDWYY